MQQQHFNSTDKILNSHLLYLPQCSSSKCESSLPFQGSFYDLEKMCPLGRNAKTIVQVLNQISQVCKGLCCKVAK